MRVVPFPRILEPEWLDELPATDSGAARSRADLRRLNALLGHPRLVARAIEDQLELQGRHRQSQNRPEGRPPDGWLPRLADLGAGDGRLLLSVARRLRRPGFATLVDLHPAVDGATLQDFRSLGWNVSVVAADATEFLERTPLAFDAVVANLFLHHLARSALERLLAAAASRTTGFVACEPRRSQAALHGSRLLWALNCHPITRHDAVASVRAGFVGRELSGAWPRREGWRLEEREAGLFSHIFVAGVAPR